MEQLEAFLRKGVFPNMAMDVVNAVAKMSHDTSKHLIILAEITRDDYKITLPDIIKKHIIHILMLYKYGPSYERK